MQLILERRLSRPRHVEFLFPLIALCLALIFSGILLWIFGANPFETYAAMATGAFGQRYHISETLLRAIPLMLTGLAVGIAFRMLFWNIGAEGQFVWGVIAATWVALFLPELIGGMPQWAFLPAMIVAAFVAGAIWGLIPAFLKTALGVNEIITTLMFNYVALLWMDLAREVNEDTILFLKLQGRPDVRLRFARMRRDLAETFRRLERRWEADLPSREDRGNLSAPEGAEGE